MNIASLPGKLLRKLTGRSRSSAARSARLEVAGAAAGTEPVEVIPVEHQGARYLVANSGDAPWVQILRASGKGKLSVRERQLPVSAEEIPVDERAPIIAAYRARAGKVVDEHWTSHPDPADHPVFKVTNERARGGGSAW
ncbi:MAG: nitroreductase family deazaflavin-dependent oxidoreductase [Acidimicrobiia bacterium]|nr:nitroreductase family deazaflavin-dependent oxidoreductase [Acidimicrobiia bacterium]